MPHFKAIFVAILSFWFSSSLIGMESLYSWFKKSDQNNSYVDENIQSLILFKNADITDKYDISLPPEVKNIITKNAYILLPSQSSLPQDNIFDWNLVNDKKRIDTYKGAMINSYDLITMNDEGKKVFKRLTTVIPHQNNDGIFEHLYTNNSIRDITALENCAENPENELWRQLAGRKYGLLLPNEYNQVLQLPLNLRRKVGESCTVKVVGEEQVSFDAKYEYAMVGACLGGIGGFIVGTLYHMETLELKEDLRPFVLISLAKHLEKEKLTNLELISLISLARRHLEELKKLEQSVELKYPSKSIHEEMKAMGLSSCCGAVLGAIVGVIIARDNPHDKVFTIVEKPLITPQEQKKLKKLISSQEEKAYNEELDFLQQHRQAIYDDLNKKPITERNLEDYEQFYLNRNAIEKEIESFKNHRIQFTNTYIKKTNDFEDVQTERNTANTKKLWNDLPWYRKIISTDPSQINPDIEIFNALKQKRWKQRQQNHE
jgi:hypothetical protein